MFVFVACHVTYDAFKISYVRSSGHEYTYCTACLECCLALQCSHAGCPVEGGERELKESG